MCIAISNLVRQLDKVAYSLLKSESIVKASDGGDRNMQENLRECDENRGSDDEFRLAYSLVLVTLSRVK